MFITDIDIRIIHALTGEILRGLAIAPTAATRDTRSNNRADRNGPADTEGTSSDPGRRSGPWCA